MCTLYNGWSEVKTLQQKIASTREFSNATTNVYALIFIHHRFESLFCLLRVLIGSLFHKKMGPY